MYTVTRNAEVYLPKKGKKNCITVSVQNPGFPNASVIISCIAVT